MKPMLPGSATTEADYELFENRPLALRRAVGRRVQCLAGIAWITAYNEPDDVFLHPGEEFIVPNSGLLLLEAVGRCRVRITAAAPFWTGARPFFTRFRAALFRKKASSMFGRM